MARRLVVDPVTRIEGHARVTIEVGDDGRVRDARVHVVEIRGFETFCVGRLLGEMPALTSRICGICPAAHSVAAARAGDAILGAAPPPAARRLRTVLLLGQLVQSHALSFFFLSAPDLALPDEADPARRSFAGVAEAAPELMRDGIVLRKLGQEVAERIAGRRIHPAFAVPGGVTAPLDGRARDGILAALPEALASAARTLAWWTERAALHADEAAAGAIETPFLALAGAGGGIDVCGDRLRAVSASGEVLADGFDPARYADLLCEETEPWTYGRLARWRGPGGAGGALRVGPLARLAIAGRFGTARADASLAGFRAAARGPALSTFHAHHARLVEIVAALEGIEVLLSDPAILERDVLAPRGEPRGEGVGACEAPRGTLLHHYRVDGDGVVRWVNIVAPTSLNALAMNGAVRRIAERSLAGARIDDVLLAAVERGIRAFDPCLGCATHARGAARVALRLVGPGGEILDERCPGEAGGRE